MYRYVKMNLFWYSIIGIWLENVLQFWPPRPPLYVLYSTMTQLIILTGLGKLKSR